MGRLTEAARRLGCAALVAIAASVATACGEPAPERTGEAASAVVDGRDDDVDEAVVALEQGGLPECSGTLVAPDAVLTAAHCVRPEPPDAVVFGPVPARGARVAVRELRVHPGFDPTTLANDVAVVVLEMPAPTTPIAAADAGDRGAIAPGLDVTIVGYGGTSPVEPIATRRRRSGVAKIDAVLPLAFTTRPHPSQPCGGDSGGAALAAIDGRAVLVGVISSGDAACARGATFTRVDAEQSAFLDAALAPAVEETSAGPGCAVANASTGDAPDRIAALMLVAALVLRRRRAARPGQTQLVWTSRI